MSHISYQYVILLFLLFTPLSTGAQTLDEGAELGEMSDEALEEAGWVFLDSQGDSGSRTGGVMALTVGTLVHGVGHFYAGDSRTGRILLIAEGVGLGMIVSGLLLENLSNSEGSWSPLYEPLVPIGGGLFATTWLLDVIGTFIGSGQVATETETETESAENGLGFGLNYTTYSLSFIDLSHSSTFQVRGELPPFYFYPEATLGLGYRYYEFDVEGGLKFSLGRRELSFVSLEVEAGRQFFSELGYSLWALSASLGISVDLGDIFPHLDNLNFYGEVGAGTQIYHFDFNTEVSPSGTSFLIVETGFGARPIPPLLLEFGYIERPDRLIGKLSQTVGSFFATIEYSVNPSLDLFVTGEAGNGVQLSVGSQFYLFK
jgi:hypothetical protein